jgi:hypothetical protein
MPPGVALLHRSQSGVLRPYHVAWAIASGLGSRPKIRFIDSYLSGKARVRTHGGLGVHKINTEVGRRAGIMFLSFAGERRVCFVRDN